MAVLHANISVLNSMRAATGSQCRVIKRGVTLALLGSLNPNMIHQAFDKCLRVHLSNIIVLHYVFSPPHNKTHNALRHIIRSYRVTTDMYMPCI